MTLYNTPINLPAGMPLLEAVSRGIVPMNALVTSVNGVSVGAGDTASVAELLACGNGNQTNQGSPPGGQNGAINQQQFVAGIQDGAATRVNGPATTNTEPLTSAPISGATLGANVSLQSNGFAG